MAIMVISLSPHFGSVNNDMQIAQEEIFGPVLATLTFDDIEQVPELPTKSYGRRRVWTNDIKEGHQLHAG